MMVFLSLLINSLLPIINSLFRGETPDTYFVGNDVFSQMIVLFLPSIAMPSSMVASNYKTMSND